MDPNLLIPIITTVVGVVAGGVCTWYLSKNDRAARLELTHNLQRTQKQLKDVEIAKKTADAERQKLAAEVINLRATSEKYERVKAVLQRSSVVRTFHQPVLLVGPREVGKTSLLKQWHAPWDLSANERTRIERYADVPVFDFELPDQEPHFADPEVLTGVHAHLMLRVHDFPGELGAQAMIKEKVIAAHRAGIRKVLLPSRNRKDLEDVPQSVKNDIKFVFCERVDDAIREALGIEFDVTPVTAAP